MMLMHLTFSVKIKQNKQVMVLGMLSLNLFSSSIAESEKTNPVIVITHENQWVESQIKLFTENCFQSANRVSWCCFINNFHNQFLTLTKQNKTRPDRALSLYVPRVDWAFGFFSHMQDMKFAICTRSGFAWRTMWTATNKPWPSTCNGWVS